jgi:hypothetical protein
VWWPLVVNDSIILSVFIMVTVVAGFVDGLGKQLAD